MSQASDYLLSRPVFECQEMRAVLPDETDARVLEVYRTAAAKMAAGDFSNAEARRYVRELLPERDFETVPLRHVLETLSGLAAGAVNAHDRGADAFNPARELYFPDTEISAHDWEKRWQTAAQEIGWQGVARDGSLIALVSSPIWARLSDFALPHPPFALGSMAWWRAIDYETAIKLGLLTMEEFLAKVAEE